MKLLNLAYSPSIPHHELAEMERAGKRMGLPLASLERIGQNTRICHAFVRAARRRDEARMRFLAGVVREVLEPPAPTVRSAPR